MEQGEGAHEFQYLMCVISPQKILSEQGQKSKPKTHNNEMKKTNPSFVRVN